MNSAASCPDPAQPSGTKLVLSADVGSEIRHWARQAYPDECCGLLVGTPGKIEFARPTPNLFSGDPRRGFLIDSGDVRETWIFARDRNMDILGVYHSHPGGDAHLSHEDRRGGWPLQVIACITPCETDADLSSVPIDLHAWQTSAREVRKVILVEGEDQ